ncbi:MAG: ABC transporter ATP-binding protein, partial [Alphaproteobacteria bacterium]|nr:ABC transporter ATP-binding protein [Alphaproteobacteria bacterium]
GIEDFAELGEFFEQPLRVYSSGMQARLAFSLATASRPDILIVDEILSVGDAYFQTKCYERIGAYKKQGTALLLVTHSTGDVVKHCKRALLLRHGCLVHDGAPRDVCNIYMDDLFSKKKKLHDNNDGEEAVADAADILSGREEKFHTRPGYRKEEHRWGNGGAHILDYLVRSGSENYPKIIDSNSQVEFHFSVLFDADYSDITPGFLLKTHDGVFLYGTNAFLSSKGRRTISVSAGQTRKFTFSMPMNLNSGHYLASFGVSAGPQEKLEPLDRRYDSLLLTVEHASGFWGIVDFQAGFNMGEEAVNVT